MQATLLLLSVVALSTVLTLLIAMAFSRDVRDTVFHSLGAFTSHVWHIYVLRRITLDVHTVDYGALGVRVYVSDTVWAWRIRAITGNKTITARNARALHNLGYRFAITSLEPMSIPAWLVEYVEDSPAVEIEAVLA